MENNFYYHHKTKQIMADFSRMKDLMLKRLHGEITPEEDGELQVLLQAFDENRQWNNGVRPGAFRKGQRILKGIKYDRLDRLTKQKIGDIPGVLDWIPATRKERTLLPNSIRIAASVLLILGAWWIVSRSRTIKTPSYHHIEGALHWQSNSGDQPGLDAGSISLGQMEEGMAYTAGAIQIARLRNQFFIFRPQDSAGATMSTLQYNVVVGGEEDIQAFLPDSTRTQLSPRSSLSFQIYPIGTLVKEKRMTCDGQALFDVGHNYQIPTVVKTLKQEITVLGTFFKVRDYKKEDTGAVFCYTGKVSVKESGSPPKILFASQRVTVDPGHAFRVSANDFPEAHWSSPELLFDFSTMDLDSAMNEIANWYGISKVKFQPGINKKASGTVLTGPISRYLPLKRLLSIIDRNDLHFKLQDQTILVTGSTDRPDHNH